MLQLRLTADKRFGKKSCAPNLGDLPFVCSILHNTWVAYMLKNSMLNKSCQNLAIC